MPMYEQIAAELQATQTALVAVSKTKPEERILEMYQKGQRDFGENKVQELLSKYEALPKDIRWHFIGHLQRNKVKYIAPFIHLIHGIDSFRLLKEIDKQARNNERTIQGLLQFHIAEESSKFGLDIEEAKAILCNPEFQTFSNIQISGLMGMATYTDDTQQVQKEFRNLKHIFDQLKKEFFEQNEAFKEISMGMSGDYQLAIKEGSTMVRIGTKLFGNRQYP